MMDRWCEKRFSSMDATEIVAKAVAVANIPVSTQTGIWSVPHKTEFVGVEEITDIFPKGIMMNRVWAMPSSETFSIKPIQRLLSRYLKPGMVSMDPFARNSRLASYTNDLNPDTAAQYHRTALDFLGLMNEEGLQADVVLFDPPYSLRQVKEVYQSIGIEKLHPDDTHGWRRERDEIATLVKEDGIAISFGWNSQGVGKKRGFEIIEILLVAHGRDHNDTICTVERKLPNNQQPLFAMPT